jgi:hypothetical protein
MPRSGQRPEPRSTAPGAPPAPGAPGDGGRRPAGSRPRRRQQVVLAVVAVGLALFAAAVVLSQSLTGGGAGPDGHPHGVVAERPATVERPVGQPRAARLEGRARGAVRLAVRAEVPARGARAVLDAVPAGAPLRLTFTLPSGATPAGRPTLAHAVGAGASAATLTEPETFLLDRRSGELVLPGGAGGGAHVHEPGAGLAQSVPGGGDRWQATLPPRAGRVALDPSGRFLAVGYAGRVELVDLLRHERAGSVRVGGHPGAMAFQPAGGRLWVADDAGRRVVVVDPGGRRVVDDVAVGAGRKTIAFDNAGRWALVTSAGDGRATLVDVQRLRGVGTATAPGAVDVAFARSAGAFVVASGDAIRMLSPRAGGPRPGARIAMPAGARLRALGVAPDGRTGVAAAAGADALAIVDLRTGRMLHMVEAGDEPSDVVFLGRFALARNARSADLTWVDLDEPSRSNNLPIGRHPAAGLSLRGDGRAALATLPGEQQVAVVHVMMGRPMVMDGITNRIRADVATSASPALLRTGPRVLEQRTVLEQPGRHRLVLRLGDGSRARFVVPVSGADTGAGRVIAQRRRLRTTAGHTVQVRFKVLGAAPADAEVLALSTSSAGVRQVRAPARRAAGGLYEAAIRPPAPGVYQLSLLSQQEDLATGPASGALLRVTEPRPG